MYVCFFRGDALDAWTGQVLSRVVEMYRCGMGQALWVLNAVIVGDSFYARALTVL